MSVTKYLTSTARAGGITGDYQLADSNSSLFAQIGSAAGLDWGSMVFQGRVVRLSSTGTVLQTIKDWFNIGSYSTSGEGIQTSTSQTLGAYSIGSTEYFAVQTRAVMDGGAGGVITWTLAQADNPQYSSIILSVYTIAGFDPDTGDGWGDFGVGDTTHLSTAVFEAAAVVFPDPLTGLSCTQTITGIRPTWNASANAASYDVIIDGTTYNTSNLYYDFAASTIKSYHIRVVPKNINGSGTYAEIDFTPALPGDPVANWHRVNSQNILSWSSTGVRVFDLSAGGVSKLSGSSNTTWTDTAPILGVNSYSITARNSFGSQVTNVSAFYSTDTTIDGYDVHPARLWCQSGAAVGDIVMIPCFGADDSTTPHILKWGETSVTPVPVVSYTDATFFLFDFNLGTSLTDICEDYSLGYKDTPTVNGDDWSFLTDATVVGGSVSTGGFGLVRFSASGAVTANTLSLPVVSGHTYDLAWFGNSTVSLFYLFEGKNLIWTEQQSNSTTTLAFSGSYTIIRAKTATARNYRIGHTPLTRTNVPAHTMPLEDTGEQGIAVSNDGAKVWFGRGSILYESSDKGQTYSVLKDFSTIDPNATVGYIQQMTSGHLLVNITFPNNKTLPGWNADSIYYDGDLGQYIRTWNISRGSELWRSDSTTPGAAFTKVLNLPFNLTATHQYHAFLINGQLQISETVAGRWWLGTYGLEHEGVTYADCLPTLYYSDNQGLNWTDLGSPNLAADSPWGVNKIRHIEEVFVDTAHNSLQLSVGDFDGAVIVVLNDADKSSPVWGDFVNVVADDAGVDNNGFYRPAELNNRTVIWGVDRSPYGVPQSYIDGSSNWHMKWSKMFSGFYGSYKVLLRSPFGLVYAFHPSTDGVVNGTSLMASLVTIDGSRFVHGYEYEDTPFMNDTGAPMHMQDRRGSRYAYMNSISGTAYMVDLEPFVYRGAWLVWSWQGDQVRLDWSMGPFAASYKVYKSLTPGITMDAQHLIYEGASRNTLVTPGYYYVVQADTNYSNEILGGNSPLSVGNSNSITFSFNF